MKYRSTILLFLGCWCSPGAAPGCGGRDGLDGAKGTGGVAAGSGTGGRGTAGSASGGAGVGGVSGTGGSASGGASGPALGVVAGVRGGPGKVDGVGATARFSDPYDLASDGAGNLYVTDSGNHTVRKIAVATGVVTTLAGSPGVPGSTDGTGDGARFTQPQRVASDGAGNLFVADGTDDGCRIRKIVITTGVVTTVAETQQCDFSARYHVASDGAGNLFFVTPGLGRLQQMVTATGVVTTLVESAGIYSGMTFAADGAGTLFFTDGSNSISGMVIATGVATTLAGSAREGSADGTGAAASFSLPEALAVDHTGNLFVSDSRNSTIRQVVIATGAVTTLAGSARNGGASDGTADGARFSEPMGLTSDGAGNLFVADTYNHAIRRVVTTTGAVTTIAGSLPGIGFTDGTGASVRFDAPNGLASDGSGDLFVADTGNHTIRRIVAATGVVTTLAGSPKKDGNTDGTGAVARFLRPRGLASDGAGNLFITTDAHTIRKLVIATGVVTTLAGLPAAAGATDGTGAAARFNYPRGLASDGSGNLFVADSLNHIIRKVVVATGTVTTVAGSAGMPGGTDGTGAAARFSSPTAVATDSEGNLLVADAGNSTIRRVIVASGAVTTIAGSAGMPGSTDGTGSAARFYGPSALAYDGAGNLFVAESGNGTVRKLDIVTGRVTTLVGSPGVAITLGPLPAGLNTPMGLAIGASGRLFIIDENALLVVQ